MPRVSERPTTPPSFSLVRYATERQSVQPQSTGASESNEVPHSETRIVTRPKIWAVVTDEVWAGDVAGLPVITASPEDLRALPLDHRAGFLLSLMDGSMDLETVIDLAAMPRADALRIARDLFEAGVIAFH